MDLRAVANRYTQTINPNIPAKLSIQSGYTTDDAGLRTASETVTDVIIQAQAMNQADLNLAEKLGLQGQLIVVYLHGNYDGLDRQTQEGAAHLTFERGGRTHQWKVVNVSESWPDWCRLMLSRQELKTP